MGGVQTVMSRSYRKNPILKDGGRSSKKNKQLANRKVRRELNRDVSEESLSKVQPKKMYESYDVNDWISRYTKEEAEADYYNRNRLHGEWFYEKYPTLEDWLKYWEKTYRRK